MLARSRRLVFTIYGERHRPVEQESLDMIHLHTNSLATLCFIDIQVQVYLKLKPV